MIVEDSNAGFEFYKEISENKTWYVESANGKSGTTKMALDCNPKFHTHNSGYWLIS